MQETRVRFLSQEDSLEKEMATHFSSCLENPMNRGVWQAICCSAWGRKELDTTEWLKNNNDKMVIFSKNCFYWIMSFR